MRLVRGWLGNETMMGVIKTIIMKSQLGLHTRIVVRFVALEGVEFVDDRREMANFSLIWRSRGRILTHSMHADLISESHLILICMLQKVPLAATIR